MKKLLLSFYITIQLSALAQIPNSGFENWVTVNNCLEPTSWHSLYALADSLGTYCPVTKSTDHYPVSVGNYSVRITNDTAVWNTGIAPANLVGWGMLVSTKMNDKPLFPVPGHPVSLCGYYKFLPQNGDTMNIDFYFYKNGIEITNGKFQSNVMASNWTPFQVFVSNPSYISVDSARMSFSPSNEPKNGSIPHGNSVLYVDNLSFDSLISIGISDNSKPNWGSIFPNPASDKFNIVFTNDNNRKIDLNIYNNFGQLVLAQKISSDKSVATLDISQLTEGIYFVHMITEKQVICAERIIITR